MGSPCVTVVQATVQEIRQLRPKCSLLVTPYIAEINNRLQNTFLEVGLPVTGVVGMGLDNDLDIGTVPPEEIRRFVVTATQSADPVPDCVFVSCTTFRAFEVAEDLERELGIPVVTSNRAVFQVILFGTWDMGAELREEDWSMPKEVVNEAELLAAVKEDSIVKLLQRIIQIETTNPPGNELDLACWLADYFAQAGVKAELLAYEGRRANLVARLQGRGSRPALIFSAHMDTGRRSTLDVSTLLWNPAWGKSVRSRSR